MSTATLSTDQLQRAHCRALEGHAAMSAADVHAQLAAVPEWRLNGDAIARDYRFADYYQTIAFVNALAFMVHREDHHPDLAVSYNRCAVRFNTHSVGGLSLNDFICAAKADALYAGRAGA